MGEVRWVHCRFCQQTYSAGKGARCSLCGNDDALLETVAPPPADPMRASWSAPARTIGGVALAAGCLAMVVGAAVGVAMASIVIDHPQALELGNAAAEADQACGLSAIPAVFSKFAVAACAGAIAGGVVAALAMTVVSWLGFAQPREIAVHGRI